MASANPKNGNLDAKTVEGFGEEWTAFDQSGLSDAERLQLFSDYFSLFPWHELPPKAEGFDLGCGSGRWAGLVATRIGKLHCIDASPAALAVARRNLASHANVDLHLASVESIPLPDASQDFGYSLGVLHHVPDTAQGLAQCVRKLKQGAPFLVYLYYRFDNRPGWYRLLWRTSDSVRHAVSRLPFGLRRAITDAIAALVYWPLALSAALGERLGLNVSSWPLSAYRTRSFYAMRTDSLDRFGTKLEQRFTRAEIESMMRNAGLEGIAFREAVPYWVAIGWRASPLAGDATASEAIKR
jgi:SAM-dependent methyltransferase